MMKKLKPLVIKGGYVKVKMSPEELEVFMRERKRGCGRHKSKRDYTRKKKHKDKEEI